MADSCRPGREPPRRSGSRSRSRDRTRQYQRSSPHADRRYQSDRPRTDSIRPSCRERSRSRSLLRATRPRPGFSPSRSCRRTSPIYARRKSSRKIHARLRLAHRDIHHQDRLAGQFLAGHLSHKGPATKGLSMGLTQCSHRLEVPRESSMQLTFCPQIRTLLDDGGADHKKIHQYHHRRHPTTMQYEHCRRR